MDGERSSVKLPAGKPVIPLSLEDCCLAWLVSDLEHYPPELLALLPLRLRHRLLANIPVLDLCRLEYTSVAEGVNLESIWELKCSPWGEEGPAIPYKQRTTYLDAQVSSLSWKDQYLHAVANTILNNNFAYSKKFLYHLTATKTPNYFNPSQYYTVVSDWLISLRGYQFLNEGGDLQSSYDWQNLASSFFFFEAERGDRHDRLTPPRYVHYKNCCSTRPSDEELITLLLRNCHFKPKFLILFSWFTDDVSPLLKIKAPCTLKEFLDEVKEVQVSVHDLSPPHQLVSTCPCKHGTIQRRRCSSQLIEQTQKSIIGTIANMIEWLTFLETIYFDIRGRFIDTVLASSEFTALAASLISFVARPQFRTLDIHSFPVPVDVVTDILSAFLVSPCSHKQTLKLPHFIHAQQSPKQLCQATPRPAEAMPVPLVPDSGLEYKELYLHPQQLLVDESYAQILCSTVFAFPKIRLRFLEVGYFQTKAHDYVNTLHMAAQHPDIQVKTLSIQLLYGIKQLLPTLRDDMRAILQIPTLANLNLPLLSKHAMPCNIPGNTFLPILAQELPKRHHLAAIEELDLGRSNFLELPAEEVEHLFQSIFSLPHLSQLTLRMNYCVVSIHHYKLIHRLWTEYSSGERLKKLVLGSGVLMSEKESPEEFSVSGILSLLDSMAQSTSVVRCFREQLTGVKTDLIKAEFQISDPKITSLYCM